MIIIIIIYHYYKVHFTLSPNALYLIPPGHWANIINSCNLSQLPGEYTAHYVQP